MAAHPQAPVRTEETTASPIDAHVAPVVDQRTPQGRTRDGRAIAALVISIVAIPMAFFFPFFGLIAAIVSLVLGIVARGDIRRTGRAGGGQATAAIVCSIIALAVMVLSIAVAAIMVAS
jgi:hypothetical protein